LRLKNELIEASNKIKNSIEHIQRDQLIFTSLGLFSFLFLFFLNDYHVISFLKTAFLLIFLVFCVWKIVLEKPIEKKHLQSVYDSMKFILKSRYDHSIPCGAQENKSYKD
jgi:Ca2+/Na+ antiporter